MNDCSSGIETSDQEWSMKSNKGVAAPDGNSEVVLLGENV
jgi:hypothetical protein